VQAVTEPELPDDSDSQGYQYSREKASYAQLQSPPHNYAIHHSYASPHIRNASNNKTLPSRHNTRALHFEEKNVVVTRNIIPYKYILDNLIPRRNESIMNAWAVSTLPRYFKTPAILACFFVIAVLML
jgi:hypothetical protein